MPSQAEKALIKAAEKALIKAAEKGDLATLKRLVAEGVNVHATDENGRTALIVAAVRGKLDCLEHLTAKGAKLDAKDNKGNTALILAAGNSKLDCLEHLIAKGANLEATYKDGWTALILAAYNGKLGCLEHLVAKGANVNAQTKTYKFTALHEAAINGHAPCVASLLKAGADASLKDHDGDTALDIAKKRKHTEVVTVLEKYTPAYFAAQAAAAKAAAAKAAAAEKMAAEKAAAAKAAAAKAAAALSAKEYGLLEPLEALKLGADELSRVTAAAVTYCNDQEFRSVADLVKYERLEAMVASLDLKVRPQRDLLDSLKARPSSGDMAKPSVAGENVARFSAKEMEVAIDELNDGILGRERLAYHFTSKETAACIMSDVSFGLRASKEGQMGGGLFMCKTPPHQMGWDSYGGPAWREGVGKKLWGTKWEEVLLGNEHADKLEAVIIVRIPKSLFDNKARVLDGRESILVIPNHDPNLTKHGDDFYLAKENVVKVYTLDSEEEKTQTQTRTAPAQGFD